MGSSNEKNSNKEDNKSEKPSPEDVLSTSLVEVVQKHLEGMPKPRFFVTYKLPEKRKPLLPSEKSEEKIVTKLEPYLICGREVKDAGTTMSIYDMGLNKQFNQEDYGFEPSTPMGSVDGEQPIFDKKSNQTLESKETQTSTEAYLNHFICDL